jgi:CubicO group peptidase (beta-lactamase class C family)
MFRRLAASSVLLLAVVAAPAARQNPPGRVLAVPRFDAYLEALRFQAAIPGLSAVLIQDGEVVWERGFGFQNLEARIRATPDTPYLVGDLSQTIAAALLLQCVEWRQLDLDTPVRQYGVFAPDPLVTMRHLLSHTASGIPLGAFRYDPERYAQLTEVMTACAPQPYRKSVSHRILEHLAMLDSVPGRDLQNPFAVPEGLYDPAHLERYRRVLERLAIPYRVDRRGRAARTELPVEGINAATGLVTTARDLAKFDIALDSTLLLEETRTMAWTNGGAGGFTAQHTGLGWFVQNYRGERVVWHFGLIPNAYSSLVLKLPSRRLTVIMLANSDGLNAAFQLHNGDVTRSLFANLFLRLFVS